MATATRIIEVERPVVRTPGYSFALLARDELPAAGFEALRRAGEALIDAAQRLDDDRGRRILEATVAMLATGLPRERLGDFSTEELGRIVTWWLALPDSGLPPAQGSC
ncbi:MAG: hypothetical protein ACREJ5_17125 [Geminicoccaceae bacterium]